MNPFKVGDRVMVLRVDVTSPAWFVGLRVGHVGVVTSVAGCPCGMPDCLFDTDVSFPIGECTCWSSTLKKVDDGYDPARWGDCVWQPEEVTRQRRIDEILEHS